MPILNRLTDEALRGADRILAWMLILLGYVIAVAMTVDPSGWDDPVFNIVRRLPFTPYSWSALLLIASAVYTVGEVMSERSRRRGATIITGAVLCSAWWMAMTLAMSRMVYVMPDRITELWPLVCLLIACLYASRMIVYANAFSGDRWATNPYQLWFTLYVMVASLGAVIIGVAPSSVFTEIERPIALQLALVNFMGASVVMFGLHLKNKEVGLNLELSGAVSLVAPLGWYCATVLQHQLLAGTTLGFAAIEAGTLATLHRCIQILTKKWAEWRGKPRLARRMSQALNAERIVVVEPTEMKPPPRPGPRHGR